jgi:hypothetical protein
MPSSAKRYIIPGSEKQALSGAKAVAVVRADEVV